MNLHSVNIVLIYHSGNYLKEQAWCARGAAGWLLRDPFVSMALLSFGNHPGCGSKGGGVGARCRAATLLPEDPLLLSPMQLR